MKNKISLLVILSFVFIFSSCSNDDDPVTPATGEVLLAQISADSVGITSGLATRSMSITSGSLNFTDRSNARISFFYSGENNSISVPLTIFYSVNDSTDVFLYNSTITPTTTEQFVDVTVASPGVNTFFKYKIATSSAGFSYFKFRDLKIYKK